MRRFAPMRKLLTFPALISISLIVSCNGGEGGGSGTDATGTVLPDSVVSAESTQPNDSLNEYLADNPFDINALLARADRYIEQKNIPYAEADVRAAMELDSLNPEVLLHWGDIHFFKNQTRESRNAWLKCIDLDPDNVDCRLKLAELYSLVQNYRESLKLVNKVIELDPEEPVAYYIKGSNIRDMTGDTALAIRYVQEAIELDPDYWTALDYAAVMSAGIGDPVAEGYYKRLLEINPEHQPTYYKMGMFYMQQERWNEAISSFTTATEMRPTDYESFFNLGYIHLELGVNNVAADYFTKSIQARQANFRAYYGRGFVYERMGDIQRAASDYRQALAYKPDHVPSQIGLRRVMEKMPN